MNLQLSIFVHRYYVSSSISWALQRLTHWPSALLFCIARTMPRIWLNFCQRSWTFWPVFPREENSDFTRTTCATLWLWHVLGGFSHWQLAGFSHWYILMTCGFAEGALVGTWLQYCIWFLKTYYLVIISPRVSCQADVLHAHHIYRIDR